MLELLSTSAPLTNTGSLLSALRLAEDHYRDRTVPGSVVPIETASGLGIQIRAWKDREGKISLELTAPTVEELERQDEDD